LANLNLQIKNKKISVCFGSKKLFKERQRLNTPEEITDWNQRWELARNHFRIAIGNANTPHGNPEIQYLHETQKIRIRLAEDLVQERLSSGTIKGIIPCRFLEVSCSEFPYLEKFAKKHGKTVTDLLKDKPITAKILRKDKGYYVQLNMDIVFTEKTVGLNILGIDFNADGLGYVIVKPDGNRKSHCKGFIRLDNMTEQTLSEALENLFKYGEENGCNQIAIENLDFFQKKAHMRTGKKHNKTYHKMLSQLMFAAYESLVVRKTERKGWNVHLVNPAYSSISGYVKWGFAYRESADISAGQSISRQALYGEEYTKKDDLPHIVRHKLKQESIPLQGYFYSPNQRKKTGDNHGKFITTWRGMGKVLNGRREWKRNLTLLQHDAWEYFKEVTSKMERQETCPFSLCESENIPTAVDKPPLEESCPMKINSFS